jgi:hypothetical protein
MKYTVLRIILHVLVSRCVCTTHFTGKIHIKSTCTRRASQHPIVLASNFILYILLEKVFVFTVKIIGRCKYGEDIKVLVII